MDHSGWFSLTKNWSSSKAKQNNESKQNKKYEAHLALFWFFPDLLATSLWEREKEKDGGWWLVGEGDNKLVRVGEMWPIWVSYCFHCFLMSQPATQLHTILPPSQVFGRICKGGDQRPFTQCVNNYLFWAMIASLTGVGYTGSLHYIQGGGNMVQGCDKRPLLLWLLVWNSLLLPVLVSTVSNKPFLATLVALTSPLSVSWSVVVSN